MTKTLPTIHTNGTGRKSLQECYGEAAKELNDFIEAWGKIEFNSRDYYVVDGAWNKAVAERLEMSAKIKDVRDYLKSIREHLHA
jgi:hypothetical protein